LKCETRQTKREQNRAFPALFSRLRPPSHSPRWIMHLTASTAEIFARFVGKADSFMQSSRNLGQLISRKPSGFSNQLQRKALTQHFCRNSERNIAAPQTEKVFLFMVNILLAIGTW